MRILILGGRIDRSELCLYKFLAQNENNYVHVIGESSDEIANNLRAAGVTYEEFKIKNRLDLQAIKKIRQVIELKNIEIIYSPTNRGLSTSLFASRNKNIPIVSYRGTLGHLSWFSPASRIAHLHPRVTKIVSNCDAVYDFLVNLGIKKDKLVRVYKGHNPEWYSMSEPASLNNLRIPSAQLILGCVANIRKLKGVDLLIKACKLIESEIDFQLIIIGENRDHRLLPLVKKLELDKRIHFLGFRSDASSIMKLFDLAFMPSTRREGLARSIVEAQLLGIPALVSNVGGLPEIVVNGETGIVFENNNPKAIADAIKFCFYNPDKRKEFAENAKSHSAKKFNTEQYLQAMQQVFQDCLAK